MTRLARYRDDLTAALTDRLVPIDGGPLDGQQMMSSGVLMEALASVPFPPVDDHVVEVITPATIYVDLRCHLCGEYQRATVRLESKTLVDDKRRTIAPKVDADTVDHICGQMPLPRPVGPDVEGQEAFDWTVPVGDIPDTAGAARDFLSRIGVTVTAEAVEGWTDAEREAAMSWAVSVHVARESGEVPDPDAIPEHVRRDGHASIVVMTEPEDSAVPDPTADGCPYPGCTRPADHRGRHKPAIDVGTDNNPDTVPDPDTDLLPGEFPEGYGEGAE